MAGNNGLVEKITEAPALDWDKFQASTGVILELHPIPGGRIQRAKDEVPRPKPPVVPAKQPGEEPLENTADPVYLARLNEYEEVCRKIGLNIALSEGTRVLYVPEGMFPVDDDRWIEHVEDPELVTFKLSYVDNEASYAPKVHRTGKMRYIDYLVQYALGDGDYNVLLRLLTSFAGKILEDDVEQAEDSFRDLPRRDSNPRLPRNANPRRGED